MLGLLFLDGSSPLRFFGFFDDGLESVLQLEALCEKFLLVTLLASEVLSELPLDDRSGS